MKIDATLTKALTLVGSDAARLEREGFDGIWTGETTHDSFLTMSEAARATDVATIGTAVSIAFARSPMVTAYAAYDLAALSEGRFVLGLGSQVKAHIERRFSMPWSRPAARMREYVLALRAIWASWTDGTRLDFEGEFTKHSLMTPFFSPPVVPTGPPPVYLAAVGPLMTAVAGEVCDGFFFHPFTTQEYLRDVTVPALEEGRRRGGGVGLDDFCVAGPAFVCTGRTDEEMATAIAGTKAQIAFYGSTPTYRPVLEHHGWGDAQPELTRLSKEGRWADMGDVIDDEMLAEFAVVGDPASVGRGLVERWGPLADRISLYVTYDHEPSLQSEVIDAIRSAPANPV